MGFEAAGALEEDAARLRLGYHWIRHLATNLWPPPHSLAQCGLPDSQRHARTHDAGPDRKRSSVESESTPLHGQSAVVRDSGAWPEGEEDAAHPCGGRKNRHGN